MRKILVTNDDGIMADGIIRLARAAKEFGEVWVVAPKEQRSAASHSITLHTHIDIYPQEFPVEGVHAFACSGMPADCVRVGCRMLVPQGPDLVLSGINYGYNSASDLQYSATAGAAFEAVFLGIPGIALSEGADPYYKGTSPCHEAADAFLRDILAELVTKPYLPGRIWNVNFPFCPLSECKGVLWDRKVSASSFFYDRYVKTEDRPNGGIRCRVEGIYNEEGEEGTDFMALVNNFVSVGLVQNLSTGRDI